MSYKSIDPQILRDVIATLRPLFQTKDVSEHPAMLRAHAAEAQARNYHADVGRAISAHHGMLEVEDQHRSSPRGTTWRKTSSFRAAPASAGSERAGEDPAPDLEGLPPRGAINDVAVDTLRRVVASQRRTFATRDVSEDGRMREAHRALAVHPSYHAFVGRALSLHRDALGLDELRKGSSRGSIWEKRSGQAPGASAGAPRTTGSQREEQGRSMALKGESPRVGDAAELGPQHAGDSVFTAQMRRHQSWYRSRVLGLPYGPGPTSRESRLLGNMLTPADGERGANFVTPAIGAYALERVRRGGGAVEPYRLLHNMLSSQPMCFNLFAQLALDLEGARPFVAALVPETVAAVTRVDLEWAPIPSDEYLGDRTAFDAAIEYVTDRGETCLLGIETKLTEPFSPGEYTRESYHRWTRGPRSPWRPEAWDTLYRTETNQLWRDHLLAIALRDHPRSDLSGVRFMVVHHPLDRDCLRVLAGYRELLVPGDDSFRSLGLDALIARWRPHATTTADAAWLDALSLRYLALERSSA